MAVELLNLTKCFGDKKVLDNLSCTIPETQWTLITGPSGCGKTTFFRILLGLEKKDSGEIRNMPVKCSAVFQENRLCEELSAVDNIRLVCAGVDKIEAALEELGLSESKEQKVSELSGGMKRRVAIARAVLAEADIFLLDEPFYGLDKERKERVMDFLIQHLQEKTTILVTHDKEAVEYLKSKNRIAKEIDLNH